MTDHPETKRSDAGEHPTKTERTSSLWYKDAVIYQVHVRSFFDANADGYGDFRGLRQKLPYIEELGVNTIWILPFYESPLRDDGYDIADYYKILPVHGDLDDFKALLDDAHARGMRVITELVLNHTSDQHHWFQEARQPGSPRRDWYVWSETPERYKDVRIIFTDTEHSNWSWDPVAGAYYWHRFFSHQPDLNWDNPEVERAMHEVMFHWLDMGVDGLRLDAVPYLYEREGTSGENLPETLDAIKRLRRAMDERYGGEKILLAEANQWPEDTLPYFGDGDGVQMAFNFPVMPRMYMAVRRENRSPIVEMLKLTENIPDDAQWALFLRNHDELTLEMVTDEERDYMYNEYASDRQFRLNLGIRRRLAPLLGGERRRIELMNAMILSLKGSPILYYGDEIMMGDNVFLGDRNGVRTPMQWSPDRNAGFSKAPYHQLFLPPINEGRYAYEFVNVEEAQNSPHSLYYFVKRILSIRNQHAATFGRGTFDVLPVENGRIFAYLRRYEGETILVVINLSRFAQAATLPLDDYAGMTPVELFGQSAFPTVRAGGYPITMSPHGFFWFLLESRDEDHPELESGEEAPERRRIRTVEVSGGLETVLVDTMLQGKGRQGLEAQLPDFLGIQRWFGGQGRSITEARLEDAVRLQSGTAPLYLSLVRVEFRDGHHERYFLPLAVASEAEADDILERHPKAGVVWLRHNGARTLLYDATVGAEFWLALYRQIRRGWRGRSLKGLYFAAGLPGADLPEATHARPLGVEQSNSSAIVDNAFLKLYRKLDEGANPEAEMLGYLTRAGFGFVPRVKGQLGFKRGALELTLGLVQDLLESPGDAWSYALEEIERFYERVRGTPPSQECWPKDEGGPVPAEFENVAAEVLQLARHLGYRTAEMHVTLSRAESGSVAPQPTTAQDFEELLARLARDVEATKAVAREHDVPLQPDLLQRGLKHLERIREADPDWNRIRIHGDYHLGQVLQSEGEYFVLDFEGEPLRAIEERRRPTQALRDVAGMLRSLEYAVSVALRRYREAHDAAGESGELETWADLLVCWSEAVFRESYFRVAEEGDFLPADPAVRDLLLWAYLFDKTLYEVRYELGHRPDWVDVPLGNLDRLLREIHES